MVSMEITVQSFGEFRYKVCRGTWYKIGTPDSLIIYLEGLRNFGQSLRLPHERMQFHIGDKTTGVVSYVQEGYVGRTVGDVKAPIVLAKHNSFGGDILETDSILFIRHSNRAYGGLTWIHPEAAAKIGA